MQILKTIEVFTNEQLRVRSCVNRETLGFSVSLQDIDTNEYIPRVKFLKERVDASEYAKILIQLD